MAVLRGALDSHFHGTAVEDAVVEAGGSVFSIRVTLPPHTPCSGDGKFGNTRASSVYLKEQRVRETLFGDVT